MCIPAKNVTTALVKCKGKEFGKGHFSNVVVPILCKKTVSTIGRVCLFAAENWFSANFYRMGSEILQIVKKSPVSGHSVAEQSPKQ